MGFRGVISFLPKAAKAMRLAAVSPLIEGGRVLLHRTAPWHDDFLTELLQFGEWTTTDLQQLSLFAELPLQECARILFHICDAPKSALGVRRYPLFSRSDAGNSSLFACHTAVEAGKPQAFPGT
jgi:hypothetical protein